MEEEDDPVVQEIPVFLSQALSKHLYIYQYPVKPANRDWNDATIVNASIKPRNQLVRLEVGLDTYSDKYCGSKGEQIAWNTDGQQESSRYARDKEKEKSQYFRDGVMDKIVYESNKPCTETERYAVAILQDKEMHCTPIQGIVQLRPSFNYFDKQDKRRKETDKADNEEEDEEETEAQQVTVTFARQETDVIKKAREKSFEFMSKRTAEEPWYQALWKHSDTDHADLERLKLFSGTTAASSSLGLRAREYVPQLVPAPPPEEHEPATQDARLHDRVRQILTSAKLLSFSELLSLVRAGGAACGAAGGVEAADLLAALSGAACCVRGLWTARSSDMFARRGAVPTEHMQAARDHVLYLFTQNPFVDRRKVAAAVRLPAAEVLEILTGIAKLNPRTGWELLLPPDTTFEAKHPDLVQRYNMYFEGRQRLFNEMMLAENIPKRQRKKSQRDSISSDTMMSPKPRCNSVSEDDSERKRVKNKAAGGQGKRTRNISSSSVHDT